MPAVELVQISHSYNGAPVLQDLSLQLGEGEVLGLFGHNGAGKTTCIKLMLGLLRPSSGQLNVLGQAPSHPAVRRQLGYLPENVMFYPQLSGRETLLHFARLKGASRRQAEVLLERVGLAEAAGRRVKTYSKGMRQRLGLAQALLGEPRLLLLDEPTVGLDPIATQDLYEQVDALRRQGTSVILCSHVLPGVERYIDRAAILSQGRMQALGTLAELRAQASLPIRLRFEGVEQRSVWEQRFQSRGDSVRLLNGQGLEICIGAHQKIDVVREMVNQGNPTDLEIRQPSLEDLYRYFVGQAAAAGQASVARSEEPA